MKNFFLIMVVFFFFSCNNIAKILTNDDLVSFPSTPFDVSFLEVVFDDSSILCSWEFLLTENESLKGVYFEIWEKRESGTAYLVSVNEFPFERTHCIIGNLINGCEYRVVCKTVSTENMYSLGIKKTGIPQKKETSHLNLYSEVLPLGYTHDDPTIFVYANLVDATSVINVVYKKGLLDTNGVFDTGNCLDEGESCWSVSVSENGFYTVGVEDSEGRREIIHISVTTIDRTPPLPVLDFNALYRWDYELNTGIITLSWQDDQVSFYDLKGFLNGNPYGESLPLLSENNYSFYNIDSLSGLYSFEITVLDEALNKSETKVCSIEPFYGSPSLKKIVVLPYLIDSVDSFVRIFIETDYVSPDDTISVNGLSVHRIDESLSFIDIIYNPVEKDYTAILNNDSDNSLSSQRRDLVKSEYSREYLPLYMNEKTIALLSCELSYALWREVYTAMNSYLFLHAGCEGNNKEEGTSSLSDTLPVTKINFKDALVFCNAYSEYEGLDTVYYIKEIYTMGITPNDQEIEDIVQHPFIEILDGYIPLKDASFSEYAQMYQFANGYRLPLKDEWEFAARGGISSLPEWEYSFSGSDVLDDTGWYISNSEGIIHDAMLKNKNNAGFFDMSGNLREFCFDVYNESLSSRCAKGGSFLDESMFCETPFVKSVMSTYITGYGFRICKTMVQ